MPGARDDLRLERAGDVHLISIPIDNTSVNPVRSFATAIFAKGEAFEQLWVFIVFPLVGATLAVGIWNLLTSAAPPAKKR